MRITVDDIFHHIAQELRCYSDADPIAAVDEFLSGCIFDMHLSITTDVEETELNYLKRYGKGHTFYFRLEDYEQGKALASDLYFVLRGIRPDMSVHTGERFLEELDPLYLFVQVRNVIPNPVKWQLREKPKSELRSFFAQM
jgi:hypothetical protein